MDHTEALKHLLSAQPLALATDFDGTVSEIAPTPEEAVISSRCRNLLSKLAERLPLVAVLSGRSAAEAQRLVGLPRIVYLGNHGLERWQNGKTLVDPSVSRNFGAIASVLLAARAQLNLPGLRFEEKGSGASIHYRLARDPAAAKDRIVSVLQELTKGTELKVVEGRRVVELRPSVRVDKGTALFDLLTESPAGGAIYAGDDWTDLDAFAGLRRWQHRAGGQTLAVAVASSEMPRGLENAADLVVDGVEGWADLMDALLTSLDDDSAS
jgi:trehalose 6-phosphate phosphatase